MADSSPPKAINRQSVQDRAKRHGLKPDVVFRTIAYHQLVQRLEHLYPGVFMLKGGQALHVRAATDRTTKDIDLRGSVTDAWEAVSAMIEAASVDLGDGLEFKVKARPTRLGAQMTGNDHGFNVKLSVDVEFRHLASLSVDVVTGREPTGTVAVAQFPLPFDIPGLAPASVAVYPVEDHLSDKVWATVSTYGTDGASTRFRDLYDICAIARTTDVDAANLRTAIEEERLRRAATELTHLEVPPEWESRWLDVHRAYGSEAHVPDDFVAAVELARSLIDPVLSGTVSQGAWDSALGVWAT